MSNNSKHRSRMNPAVPMSPARPQQVATDAMIEAANHRPVHVVETVGDGSGEGDYKVVEPIVTPDDGLHIANDADGPRPDNLAVKYSTVVDASKFGPSLVATITSDSPQTVEWSGGEPNDDLPDYFFGTFFDVMRNYPSYGSSEFAVGPALFALMVSVNPRTVIEIGRFTGFSTLAMAGALRFLDEMPWTVPDVQKQRPEVNYPDFLSSMPRLLLSIDPDTTYGVPSKLDRIGVGKYVQYVFENSHGLNLDEVLKGAPVDFVFLDGDHTYDGLEQDIEEYVVQRLRPGGYFVLHDYFGWYDDQGNNGSPIKRVVDEISGQYEHLLLDTGFMSLVAFRKPL